MTLYFIFCRVIEHLNNLNNSDEFVWQENKHKRCLGYIHYYLFYGKPTYDKYTEGRLHRYIYSHMNTGYK